MENKFENNPGLVDLIEVIDLGFNLIEALKQAKQNDGKIDFKDFPLLWPLFEDSSKAIDGINNALPAWSKSTGDERKAVLAHFNTRFDLADDVLEVKIEKMLLAATIVAEVILEQKD